MRTAVAALALALLAGGALASGGGGGAPAEKVKGAGAAEVRAVTPPEAPNALPAEILDRMQARLVALAEGGSAEHHPHVPFPDPPVAPEPAFGGGR